MARDDREINVGIRTLVTDTNRKARVLGAKPENLDADLTEVAGMFTQDELDRMVESGALSGTWKSTKKGGSTAAAASVGGKTTNTIAVGEPNGGGGGGGTGLPDDFPLGSVFEKLGFASVADIQAKTEEELVALEGIGEATAKKALSYGK
jgi:DNA uptake protein ComE-like DNA-binding protein